MPRLHSVSQYHSQPSIKQSPGSNMSPLPLLHLNPRTSPLKSRPATPVHFQNPACQSTKPRHSAPEHLSRSKSALRPASVNSTRPKHPLKSTDESQLAVPIQSIPTPSSTTKPANRKPTSKRSRKPREGTTSPPPALQPVSHLYNLSFPEPHQSSIESPDRLNNPSPTPQTSEVATKRQVLSLTDFCDQLTVQVHDQSFEVTPSKCSRNSKKKTSNRKSKKGGQRRAPICPQLSDSEDVLTLDHPMFIPHESPSRSGTPTPIKISESPVPYNGSTLILDDAQLASSPAATKPSSTSGISSRRPSASPVSLPPRQHVRAKSVASIFDLDKPQSPCKSRDVKDDWDMPHAAPAQGLTWQQMEKKLNKTVPSASTSGHLAQKLAQHESKSSSGNCVSSKPNTKETSTRRHRTPLARTSSASTLSQPTTSNPKTNSSRSDDESAMTWQQSILRPSLRHTLLASRSDQSVNTSESKSSNTKNAAPAGVKTPVKATCAPRKAGVTSAAKPRTSGPPASSNKRRNSLSSTRNSTVQPLENTPIHEKSRSLGLKSGENIFSEWKSFTNSADEKVAQPIFSNPLPILGAQIDYNTPIRRHAKSYTHQPTGFPHHLVQQSSQPNNSAPVFSHIHDSKDIKVMTPSKPRSTSEDLYLAATPGSKLSSPALRAAFMYAGPQFHNSPCPAALPAPKFSFGSA
ncbi:hypothetical protein PGT21_003762 [Puccinia graminis f. sp. tritici]|uniref:Uncharacterized protein n=2 Tax=Puccinia graminis f. sp. tritici TaxID=56615 RepID=A0A5B0P1M8_PUCGR|nr:hypothetical protein PGTUg99_036378 [Puccinia graminis f. sp. tritici]KAA1093939.1 hypothetical protein PGT21_003762 [Puccinia graminis f. sp. tritici]